MVQVLWADAPDLSFFSLEPCPENGYPENLDAVLCVAGFFTSPYSQSTHLPS